MMSLRAVLASFAMHLLDADRPRVRRAVPLGRIESCVPAPARRRCGWGFWVRAGAPAGRQQASRPAASRNQASDRSLALLLTVRHEFVDSVSDVRNVHAFALLERVHAARSLRELWHLRPEIFDLIAKCHSQAEADRRIALLNRHFPTRSPRSGFGAL